MYPIQSVFMSDLTKKVSSELAVKFISDAKLLEVTLAIRGVCRDMISFE